MIGRTLGHYEILEKLGEGGMGVVYKARDTHLDRFVAIKVLPANQLVDPDRKRRFVREAKAASALNHPNIVTIHQIDVVDGTDFIVMEHIDGTPLNRLIPERGLPLMQALSYVVQIADALAAAHSAGIVHRDIKPGNIMVVPAGRVKVLDFGLAKLVERAGPEDAMATGEAATRAGAIIGTIAYASPEQIEAKPVDVRTDVFSFGAVLYEMLAGRRPFQGDSTLSTMAAILRDRPKPLTVHRADAPREVCRILDRCLEKDREARYPSAVELAKLYQSDIVFRLEAEGSSPAGMVRVPAGSYQLGGSQAVQLSEYWIDKYEITNREFKDFIDRGGYQNRQFWKEPFIENRRAISWDEETLKFHDATGRPGPSSWELGSYPEGQADFPVAGLSWFEAAAYAAYAGKALPTVTQWFKAAGTGIYSDILRFSNFDRKGAARAGSFQGLGPYGTYDMAGNVKEWCWNLVEEKRYLLGGAWNEPSYMFIDLDARPPSDRSATNGFRCVKNSSDLPANLTGPIEHLYRDYTNEKPVTDQLYEAYRRSYFYDRTPLDARIESTDDSHPYWRKEKVSFRAAYGNERVPAYLFLPKNAAPPYQTLVFFPGGDVLHLVQSSESLGHGLIFIEFAMRSGRAVLFPIYNGTFERHFEFSGVSAWRDLVIQWEKEVSRSVDYLETRPDIDSGRLAFYGLSLGANRGPLVCAVETRFKTCVLLGGGLSATQQPPEIDGVNFAPRAHEPLLMLNGRYDFDQSSEMQAKPMLRLWGAAEKDKRLVIFESGHIPADLRDIIREVLDWLDKYLGPVKTIG